MTNLLLQALIPSQQQGTYYTQPLYAAPPHVIHHTTVVQPNGMPAAMYAPPIPPPRHNGVAMGMVAGTTMAMSAGEHRRTVHGCFLIRTFWKLLFFCFYFLRDLVDDSIACTGCTPPSHNANVSDPWHAQLQLRAPAVVKRGQLK